MKLDRRERKYVRWSVTGADAGMAFEISLDNVTWTAVTWTASPAPGEIKVLLRGPDAPTYAGSILVPAGTNTVRFRVTDNPEIEIDPAGTIVCA